MGRKDVTAKLQRLSFHDKNIYFFENYEKHVIFIKVRGERRGYADEIKI